VRPITRGEVDVEEGVGRSSMAKFQLLGRAWQPVIQAWVVAREGDGRIDLWQKISIVFERRD
jgi:hypothetical protein